ncbi:MAG: hypothetical protein JWP47_476 [Polaromonas sp.]|nr:hypothetical protein [Polaromonas sp.]
MFDRLKKTFSTPATASSNELVKPGAFRSNMPVPEWAIARGLSYAAGLGEHFAVRGKVNGISWKLECASSSRDYIFGDELRARAELGISEDIAVLVMNRPLKQTLEKRAYQLYTDTLQTVVEPSMPEEMRWLSMYPEVGWGSATEPLWARYSVMAEDRNHAMAWLTAPITDLLLSWPKPAPDDQLPFMLMLLRGNAYMRMQRMPENLQTLDHAVRIFTVACESALGGLSMDISI